MPTTKRKDRIKVYTDGAGQWRWTRIAANGNKTADSAEAYTSRSKAIKAAEREADPPEAYIEVSPRAEVF